jgi:hypothetical protein
MTANPAKIYSVSWRKPIERGRSYAAVVKRRRRVKNHNLF